MTCLGCNAIELESGPTVTLLTGEVVCAECPSYRLQCEAESMLNRMTLEERRRTGNTSALAAQRGNGNHGLPP